jgi:anti-anti-sigma factor
MNFETIQLEKAIVLEVIGRMDAENANEFDEACQVWISQGSKHLIADLGELRYVSSMGLRSFLAVAQKLKIHFRRAYALWLERPAATSLRDDPAHRLISNIRDSPGRLAMAAPFWTWATNIKKS